jgi:anti-sigma factor RsiW
MASIGDQIRDNREPTLLLYLFDELSPSDRAEVKRLLADDPSLQKDLEALQALHTRISSSLEELDGSTPLVTSADQSARRVMRELRRQQLEMEIRPASQLELPRRQVPRVVYAVAAVAAIIILTLGMWGVGIFDFGTPGSNGTLVDTGNEIAPEYVESRERLEDILFASFGGGEEMDHPPELEESEDPAAFDSSERASS